MGMEELDKIKPPVKLRANILMRIAQVEFRRARAYLLVSTTVGVFGIIGAVFSVKYLLQGFNQSGFYNYFSLLLSDPDIMLTYWREFSLSIVESIPVTGVIISLGAFAVFLVSVRIFANNMRVGMTPALSNS